MSSMYSQQRIHGQSIADPEKFWGSIAETIHWHKKPKSVLDVAADGSWTWFKDGEFNMAYELLEANIAKGLGESVAIYWDSPVTSQKRRITYSELLRDVQQFAGAMSAQGVRKGDVVMIYMPMVPEALVAMCACAYIGAVHSVVFGGFASSELAKRIDSATPKLLLTASAGIEEKRVTPYLPLVQKGIQSAKHKPKAIVILQRKGHEAKTPLPADVLEWDEFAQNAKPVTSPTPTKSQDILYTLYTSGTTGAPKGVSRFSAGYAAQLRYQIQHLMNMKAGSTMACLSDIGWVVGHSFIFYAPLLIGASTVLFEGKLPMRGGAEVWRVCEEYNVDVLFCAPTALRALRAGDPESKQLKSRNLNSLKSLMLAGERSEPSIVIHYSDVLKAHVGSHFECIDNYWSSESGSPITGVLQSLKDKPVPKPGSAGPPTPGFDLHIVDDDGKEVPQGTSGNIVLKTPLPPSMLSELWRDSEGRFQKSYMKRFGGKWFDTGDAGLIDEDGFVHIMARSDDIINVAAHRLSTGAFEAVITSIPGVNECCVVGMPDSLKGHVPLAFVVAAKGKAPSFEQVNKLVREEIGNIASLGGMVVLDTPLPKTRSGKTLRRVVRAYVENAAEGQPNKVVDVPATIEDASVLDNVKTQVQRFMETRAKSKAKL
ncbi:hypothetical protein BCR37DRAFT_167406 [Protomyces lactucae-debilis]|uniref:Acetyl-CoA synthetase-like protein n=1 Tax=Protomyces lactucae-debilis TaxID=2754530 RepID=A0A1Y2EWQ3_PROLT|nr:uncharacterized protein BCR37DRAFT_167406 [Protomyces lactucae-debilis]ORY76041.1 hypothetical protein BCR37DRAFT_167406 [Protomyces lactucae-debilis]